jgi:apolipoprotein N-acyltransferase
VTILRHPLVHAATSGVLLWLAFPGGGAMVALLPLALAPLLLAVSKVSGAQAALAGFVAGLVHFLLQLYWITIVLSTYGGLPWFLSFPALFFLACYMALYVAVFAVIARSSLTTSPPALSLWLLPALWVGLDWLRSLLFSGFPWMDLGYALYSIPVTIQIADLVGHYGLTYLIVMGNVFAFLLWVNRRRCRVMALPTLSFCLVLLAAGLYSHQRLGEVNQLTKTAPRLPIGVVQGNIDQSVKWTPQQLKKTVTTYLDLSQTLSQASKPALIVWPETALPFFPLDAPEMGLLRTLLRENDFALLTGVPWLQAADVPGRKAQLYNSALLLKPEGRVAGNYHKSHLVPFGEYVPLQEYLFFLAPLVEAVGDFSAGTIDRPLEHRGARLGILICFESVFADLARRWVVAGANVLVNLTNDAWYGRSSAPEQSLAMAVLRAVEARRSLVRSANTGISAFIEPSGEITSRSDIFVSWAAGRDVALIEEVTPWVRFGHLFAPSCLVLGLFPAIMALAIRRRRKAELSSLSAQTKLMPLRYKK